MNSDRFRHEYHKNPYLPRQKYALISIPIVHRTVSIHRNRYYFDRKLGQGGFGEVYAARRLPDGKQVAIKVISTATPQETSDETQKMLFEKEVRISKFLSNISKHIVHMFDYDFHSNGLAFIVMELGQHDLEQALSMRSRLSPIERKRMWQQLVSIAMTLYNNRIVHLDIKPNNLIVFPGNLIKLVDMGTADRANRIRHGRMGTLGYTAPEVRLASYSHVTLNSTKADAWSWGAVLYRMIYGESPDHRYIEPCHHPPSHRQPSHDSNLLSILRHTLVVNPIERYDIPSLAQHPYTKTP